MYRIVHGQLREAALRLEQRWDRAILRVRRQVGLSGPPLILPYRKFGTAEKIRIGGRVVEDRGVVSAPHTHSTVENLWLTFKRYATYEVGAARIGFSIGRESGTVVSDRNGFFEVDMTPARPIVLPPEESWLPAQLTLLGAPTGPERPLQAEAFVLIPPATARFGVISDIDDTIVKTGATDFLKHWRTVVANSAEARVAFRGLAPFYRALHRGVGGAEGNPLFYVSSSPWNLYDLFERYLVLHDIPLGPILLRPVGFGAGKWPGGSHHANKLAQIENILATYPLLPFILVGDSGQHDAEIYTEATVRHPGRIAAIYVRDVTEEARDRAAKGVLEPAQARGVRTAYGPDLIEAAEDSAAAGWIAPTALAEVRVADPDRPGT